MDDPVMFIYLLRGSYKRLVIRCNSEESRLYITYVHHDYKRALLMQQTSRDAFIYVYNRTSCCAGDKYVTELRGGRCIRTKIWRCSPTGRRCQKRQSSNFTRRTKPENGTAV